MVKPFQFARLPRIIFGNGRISALPELIGNYGGNVVVITGSGSFLESAPGKSISQTFSEKGIHYNLIKIPSEPSPGMIEKAVNSLINVHVNVVVAIGGGSVMDAGKAISAMLTVTGPVKEYLEGVGSKEHPGTKIPFIAVPTTSGTGSEATKNAVISYIGKEGFKKSLRHDNFVPDIALVDPELTLTCPPGLTSASGMDCFTQLMEAYLSNKASDFTDVLALEGLKAIKSSLLRSFNDGKDIEARTGMAFAALTSGICLANAGLGVVHGFASSIGGMYNIPHGVICGTLMAASNEITVRKLREGHENTEALKKYTLLGKLFLDAGERNDDFVIDSFIEHLHDLTNELKLPGLKQAGILEVDLKEISQKTECKNNPVKLHSEELLEILERRFI